MAWRFLFSSTLLIWLSAGGRHYSETRSMSFVKALTSRNTATNPAQSVTADNRYCDIGDAPLFGAWDGRAKLPTACVYTALSASPSYGKTVIASDSAGLIAKLRSVQCGDTIVLNAGTVYTGEFVLPAKDCGPKRWITIRSSSTGDSAFPPEGIRISPCHIGLIAVPYYPSYSCANPAIRMPTFRLARGRAWTAPSRRWSR